MSLIYLALLVVPPHKLSIFVVTISADEAQPKYQIASDNADQTFQLHYGTTTIIVTIQSVMKRPQKNHNVRITRVVEAFVKNPDY